MKDINTFINAIKLYFNVGIPVSLFMCPIIARNICGLESVANIVKPAISDPKVVMVKLNPIDAQLLRSLRGCDMFLSKKTLFKINKHAEKNIMKK